MHCSQQVKHLNLSRYADMLASGDYRDDLDLVTEVHSPSGMLRMKPLILYFYFKTGNIRQEF
jgi:hypothetical protein